MAQVEPFDVFLARTKRATPEQYADSLRAAAARHGLSPDRTTEDFERLKNYILSFYEGVTPVRSDLTASGQVVDWIPFDQQPSVRAARAKGFPTDVRPPTPVPFAGATRPTGETDSSTSPRTASGRPRFEGPQGTVPLVRITLERLTSLGTLDQFFHKSAGPPATDSRS